MKYKLFDIADNAFAMEKENLFWDFGLDLITFVGWCFTRGIRT